MAGILVVLMMAVMPALERVSEYAAHAKVWLGNTYKTPQLMAMATPIFSFSFICRPQMTVHGSMASAMSMAAEYATPHRQPLNPIILCLPPQETTQTHQKKTCYISAQS